MCDEPESYVVVSMVYVDWNVPLANHFDQRGPTIKSSFPPKNFQTKPDHCDLKCGRAGCSIGKLVLNQAYPTQQNFANLAKNEILPRFPGY